MRAARESVWQTLSESKHKIVFTTSPFSLFIRNLRLSDFTYVCINMFFHVHCMCMCICMYICTYMCIHSSRAGTRQKHKAFSFWSFVHLSSCSKRQSAKINLNNYIHTYMPGFSYSAYYTLLFCIN